MLSKVMLITIDWQFEVWNEGMWYVQKSFFFWRVFFLCLNVKCKVKCFFFFLGFSDVYECVNYLSRGQVGRLWPYLPHQELKKMNWWIVSEQITNSAKELNTTYHWPPCKFNGLIYWDMFCDRVKSSEMMKENIKNALTSLVPPSFYTFLYLIWFLKLRCKKGVCFSRTFLFLHSDFPIKS